MGIFAVNQIHVNLLKNNMVHTKYNMFTVCNALIHTKDCTSI